MWWSVLVFVLSSFHWYVSRIQCSHFLRNRKLKLYTHWSTIRTVIILKHKDYIHLRRLLYLFYCWAYLVNFLKAFCVSSPNRSHYALNYTIQGGDSGHSRWLNKYIVIKIKNLRLLHKALVIKLKCHHKYDAVFT